LVRPGERKLYVDELGMTYPCAYKSSTASSFVPFGKVWFEFSIVLTLTSFRLQGQEVLLASEGGDLITTEDGDDIDLKVYY
jgi:hypothetical protein